MEEGEASTSDDRADSTLSLSGPGGQARHHRHRRGADGDDEEGTSAAATDDYPHRYRPRFRRGDVVELYNTKSSDVQIAFPSIVMGYDYRAPVETSHDNDTAGGGGEGVGGGEGAGGYRVTRTTDGREITGLHERHVHPYVPYGIGDEALCNIGTYPGSGLRGGNRGDGVVGRGRGGGGGGEKGGPIIVRCTVHEYKPAATRGAFILQGEYLVRVHASRANEEYNTTLPVWKLQRRYLAK